MFPIREISSYQRKWKVKARVTSKAPIRTFNSNGRPGKVFSCDILDAEKGEIRCSFFNEAVDKCYDMLEVGKCYTFANGTVKVANKRYNNLSHNYEVQFNDGRAEVEAADEDVKIEAMRLSFQSLATVKSKKPGFVADLCGVITSVQPVGKITTKQGVELTKRQFSLADSSGYSMEITAWGEVAEQPDEKFAGQPVVAIKSVGIRDFGGHSGSVLAGGSIIFNCDDPALERVRAWKAKGGLSGVESITSVGGTGGVQKTETLTFHELKEACDIYMPDSKFHNVYCRLSFVRVRGKEGVEVPVYYMACPTCKKKVVGNDCITCNRPVDAIPKYFCSVSMVDSTDGLFTTLFDDTAGVFFGKEVAHFKQLSDEGKNLAAEFEPYYFRNQYRVTVRSKVETYQDESRVKHQVLRAEKVSPAEMTRVCLKEIEEKLNRTF